MRPTKIDDFQQISANHIESILKRVSKRVLLPFYFYVLFSWHWDINDYGPMF